MQTYDSEPVVFNESGEQTAMQTPRVVPRRRRVSEARPRPSYQSSLSSLEPHPRHRPHQGLKNNTAPELDPGSGNQDRNAEESSMGLLSNLEGSVSTCSVSEVASSQPQRPTSSSSRFIRTSPNPPSDGTQRRIDDALDRLLIQRIRALNLPPPAPPPAHSRNRYRLLVLAECLVIFASLLISLIWSSVKGDVSGGFTIGAYIVGAGTLLVMGLKNYTQTSREKGEGEEEARIELM
ncbi:hypothetical protein MMC18_000348 [Xylographa bjoerkii]|nr:hypothetical protein [Xylographa bjoerkii]